MISSLARGYRRRVSALAHLLLFACALSTSVLPCGGASPSPATEVSPSAAHHHTGETPVRSMHDQHGAVVVGHIEGLAGSASTNGHHPMPERPIRCELMVGCLSLVEWAPEVSWRAVDAALTTAVPTVAAHVLASVDREVESPPPRV